MGKSMRTRNAVIVGGTGGLGSAVVKSLKKNYSFDKLWLSKKRPDVMSPRAYEHIKDNLDLAIYFAGTNLVKPVEEITSEELFHIFSVNILGAFNFVKNLKNKMKGSYNPTFIFASSIMINHPYPNRTAYASTKAAIEGLSNALSVELGDEKISSVCLRLGHLNSLMKSTKTNPELLEKVKKKTPQGNLIDSESLGQIINNIHNFSSMYNGSVIDLDGAYTRNRWPF
jgi:dihydroanticapsin dehydrogenase